jgi:DNA-binding NarL/FixJ family response regulator
MPRIWLVDDHRLLAEALRATLVDRGLDVRVARASDRASLLARLCAEPGELVLLDLDLGVLGTATPLIAPLVRAGSRVLVVTGGNDRLAIAAALEQGAVGYLNKTSGFDALVGLVSRALATSGCLDVAERDALLAELRCAREQQSRSMAPFRRLTARERVVLRALSEGQTVAEMAHRWVLSDATVRTHVRGVLQKVGVRSQLAAVAVATRSGWLRPSSTR